MLSAIITDVTRSHCSEGSHDVFFLCLVVEVFESLPEEFPVNQQQHQAAHWCFCLLHSVKKFSFFLAVYFLSSLVFCSSVWLLSQVATRLSPNDHPLAHYAVWYNNSTPCIGLMFVSFGSVRGLCLSLSMTAARTYLAFYFEAWLTGWQPWHSCRRCGACYYAYINILINTRSAIEEIITCHHSTVRKRLLFVLVCAHARTFICLVPPKYDLCSSRSSPSINEFHSISQNPRTDSHSCLGR